MDILASSWQGSGFLTRQSAVGWMKGLEHASSLHMGLDECCCVADFRDLALVEGFIWFFVGDGVPHDTLYDDLDKVLRTPHAGHLHAQGRQRCACGRGAAHRETR